MTVPGTRSGQPLPDGWRWVRLREVIAEVQAGFACGLRDPQGIAQLRMNNLDTRGNFVWDDVLRVPREANDIDQFQILPGDVLFNNTNSTELVGKSALFEGYVEPIVYSNHFTRLRTVDESLLPDFLASWLNHQWQQGVFAAICNRWIGQSAVKADKLLNLAIPLPTLSEQWRISGVLREQMEALEKARTAAQVRLEAVKALPAAFLRQVFPQPGQPLPNGWRWVKLGEVCEKQTGIRDPRTEPETVFQYVDITSVSNQRKCITEARTVLGIDAPSRARQVIRANDIIVATTRPNLNAVAQVPSELDNQICSTGFCVLRTGVGILPDYIFAFVRYESFIEALTDLVKGALYPAVTDGQVKAQQIPLPPLSEQRRIAGLLREQMTAVEKARAAAEAELNTITALPAALLLRAFAGEL